MALYSTDVRSTGFPSPDPGCDIEENNLKIRVLLADSHPIVLHGLCSLLTEAPGFIVLDTLTDMAEVLDATRQLRPDILLLDPYPLDGPGLPLVREIVALPDAPIRVVALSAHLTHEDVCLLIQAGVSGILLKTMPIHPIMQCLRSVHTGRQWYEHNVAAITLDHLLRGDTGERDPTHGLTPRELEVATLIAQGLAIKSAATRLNLSAGSVRTYLNRIYAKLKVANRTELALYFRQKRLV